MLKEKQVKYYMYLWTFHKKTKTNKKTAHTTRIDIYAPYKELVKHLYYICITLATWVKQNCCIFSEHILKLI